MTTQPFEFFIVPSPGYYGDWTRVVSRHRTIQQALRKLRDLPVGYCVREGSLPSGAAFRRSDEAIYPRVEI